jgi:hypothetical protein
MESHQLAFLHDMLGKVFWLFVRLFIPMCYAFEGDNSQDSTQSEVALPAPLRTARPITPVAGFASSGIFGLPTYDFRLQ